MIRSAKALLESLADSGADSPDVLEREALRLAELLCRASEALHTPAELRRRKKLAGLLRDPNGQLLGLLLTDRAARDARGTHTLSQLKHLSRVLGVPAFFSSAERMQLELGTRLGEWAGPWVAGRVRRQIAREAEGLVLLLDDARLQRYLAAAHREGVLVNLNQLGEEVLGEQAATLRVASLVRALETRPIDALSIKVSSIYSQLEPIAWERDRLVLSDRLRTLYRAAKSARQGACLVYLDMEAYRDLHLTLETFLEVLAEPEFMSVSAGIVLQAYLPDSLDLLERILGWAERRARAGGVPIRLRLVKGANHAAERVQAGQRGWRLPLLPSKLLVDANYKRLLMRAATPESCSSVRLGVASHNLFDVALALCLRAARRLSDGIGFEVLEGMANATRRAVRALEAPVLVYAPAAEPSDLETAIAYLARRLDENTAPDNFLAQSFAMSVGDDAWHQQAEAFKKAFRIRDEVPTAPLGVTDRMAEAGEPPALAAGLGAPEALGAFANEADTDFAWPSHRRHVTEALKSLSQRPAWRVQSRVLGQPLGSGGSLPGFDPSRPGVVPYRLSLASRGEVLQAVQALARAAPVWAAQKDERRIEVLRSLAHLLRRSRFELVAAICLDTGKRAVEGDAEVSEAIDFIEYYSRCVHEPPRPLAAPTGSVVSVIAPWNFPLAIPMSGIAAALLAGNAVVFKPALEAAWVGQRLVELAWEAGVPEDALSFVVCRDEDAAPLVEEACVGAVVFTGSTSTARRLAHSRPSLPLFAETGGKNALIISAQADRDLAIKDLLQSAFGYSGQKCSAASLAIVDAEIHDDPKFLKNLADAAASLSVGSAWELHNRVTPLIVPPAGALLRALQSLDEGESWLLPPKVDGNNPRLWSPGLRLGVQAGSFCHQTELFGPVLAVMRAEGLEHALQLANGTPYGLVCGIHTLDEREQAEFARRACAGNLYVNRAITGAIVGRQPFGGWKSSNLGRGAKAGGPNYVAQLRRGRGAVSSPLAERIEGAASSRFWGMVAASVSPAALSWLQSVDESYERAVEEHFSRRHAAPSVPGQDNFFRYRPIDFVWIRFESEGAIEECLAACLAASRALVPWMLSVPVNADIPLLRGRDARTALESLFTVVGARVRGFARETQAELAARLRAHRSDMDCSQIERVRYVAAGDRAPDDELRLAALYAQMHLADEPVSPDGRTELLSYVLEQSVSVETHRYGHPVWQHPLIRVSPPEIVPARWH